MSGIIRITIPNGTDPATVTHVLQLNANAVGIDKVQFVGVSLGTNHRLDARCLEFLMRGPSIEALETKSQMVRAELGSKQR